jgi:hypothetical protein
VLGLIGFDRVQDKQEFGPSTATYLIMLIGAFSLPVGLLASLQKTTFKIRLPGVESLHRLAGWMRAPRSTQSEKAHRIKTADKLP